MTSSAILLAAIIATLWLISLIAAYTCGVIHAGRTFAMRLKVLHDSVKDLHSRVVRKK